MKYERKSDRIVIHPSQQYAEKSVGDFLDEYLISRKNRYLLIQNRQILLDDEAVKNAAEIIGGHDITIMIPEEEPGWIPADKACTAVYENDFVYVVHKEAGVIIHGDPGDTECLCAMAAKWQEEHGIHTPVRPIHRLDRDTCGLVFFSKIPFFQPWLDACLAEKEIRRHYLAITRGRSMKGKKYTFRDPIGRDRHQSGVYRISRTGVDALTRAECLDVRNGYLLFGCELETGRTHQIRLHLSHHGFPIVNDPLYGTASKDFRNMGLWADEITFRDPLTRKKHRIHDTENEDYSIFQGETRNDKV